MLNRQNCNEKKGIVEVGDERLFQLKISINYVEKVAVANYKGQESLYQACCTSKLKGNCSGLNTGYRYKVTELRLAFRTPVFFRQLP